MAESNAVSALQCAAARPLDVDDDFTDVSALLTRSKRLTERVERKRLADHRLDAVGLDGVDHVELERTRTLISSGPG